MTNQIKVTGIYTDHIQPQHDLAHTHLDMLNIEHVFTKLHATNSDTGEFQSKVWKEMVLEKISFAIRELKSSPPDRLTIFTDMDVIPLQHYNNLIKYIQKHDICFMSEDEMYDIVNTGFILTKTTSHVIKLFEEWYDMCCEEINSKHGKFKGNQPVLNNLLSVNKIYMKHKNFFPVNIITSKPMYITKESVACHVIGTSGNEEKIKRMKRSIHVFNKKSI